MGHLISSKAASPILTAFEHQDLAVHTEAVLSLVGTVTVDKHIWIFPNQKPWMTSQVSILLKDHNFVFVRSSNKKLLEPTWRKNN